MQLNKPKVSLKRKTKVLLLCFFTALTFWFFHAMNIEHTALVSIPVSVEFIPKTNQSKVITQKTSFKVSAKGNGWNLLSKKIGFGVNKIQVTTENNNIQLLSSSYRKNIIHDLKEVTINYILPDTLIIYK